MRAIIIAAAVLASACGSFPTSVAREAARTSWRAPGDVLVTTSRGEAAMRALHRIASKLGVEVTLSPDLLATQGLFGLAVDRHIVIDNTVPLDMQLDSLAHELGHILQPPNLEHAEAEVFAELVAASVCRRVGIDTRHQSARYLADYRSGLDVAQRYADDIAWAVDVLMSKGSR